MRPDTRKFRGGALMNSCLLVPKIKTVQFNNPEKRAVWNWQKKGSQQRRRGRATGLSIAV